MHLQEGLLLLHILLYHYIKTHHKNSINRSLFSDLYTMLIAVCRFKWLYNSTFGLFSKAIPKTRAFCKYKIENKQYGVVYKAEKCI